MKQHSLANDLAELVHIFKENVVVRHSPTPVGGNYPQNTRPEPGCAPEQIVKMKANPQLTRLVEIDARVQAAAEQSAEELPRKVSKSQELIPFVAPYSKKKPLRRFG